MATTFSETISEQRKLLNLSLRELAGRVKKDGGGTISAQYLNDIEHGRRNPPSSVVIRELARELKLSADYLLMLANDLPERDQRLIKKSKPETVTRALEAFRKTLREE